MRSVLRVLAEAVHGSTVPLEARGGFEVKIGPDGSFAGIRVLGTSAGDARAWDQAARAAAKKLRSRRLPLRPDERGGVVVKVEVESRNRLPAGSETVAELEILCADEAAYQAIERDTKEHTIPKPVERVEPPVSPQARRWVDPASERETEFEPERIGQPPLPAPDARPPQSLCVPNSLVVRFDLSNIGAHKTRTVRSTARVTRAPSASASVAPPPPPPPPPPHDG